MKVAIVAPESVPYVQGGAENLYQSLCEHINNNTPHSCEIITLPSPESNFKEVLSSYKSFLIPTPVKYLFHSYQILVVCLPSMLLQ